MTEGETPDQAELEPEIDTNAERGWLAEQVRLIDLEDGLAA